MVHLNADVRCPAQWNPRYAESEILLLMMIVIQSSPFRETCSPAILLPLNARATWIAFRVVRVAAKRRGVHLACVGRGREERPREFVRFGHNWCCSFAFC
jgi:hypothetical protein